MKVQAKELDYKYYDLDNMCNSCGNPLPVFEKIVISIGSNRYNAPLCVCCLKERGIKYE